MNQRDLFCNMYISKAKYVTDWNKNNNYAVLENESPQCMHFSFFFFFFAVMEPMK